MTPLVDYWLKANLFLVLFYGCYALLLRRHTFLTLNRTYLMGSLMLAFVLPLVHIPGLAFPWPWETTNVPEYTAISVESFSVAGVATEAEAPLLPDWPTLALWAFALMATGLLIRTVWRTTSLLRLIRQWPAQPLEDHTLVLPDKAQTPTFSFFRYLVLNPDDAQADAVRQHELVHIRQKHSLDVLLLEVIHALCWLNPVLFGYRQAIRQVHEYLADRDATPQTTDDRDAYARFLVSYAFHLPADTSVHDSLVHSFGPDRPDSPTLKQRIQMLYQQHTRRRALWKYALVLPLATILLAMTTEPETELAAEPPVADSTTTIRVTGRVSNQSGPLPGATIVVRKGNQGTTTDMNGTFSIDVARGTELVASFVGFSTESVVVPAKGENIVLSFKLKQQGVDVATLPTTAPTASQTVPAKATNEVFSVVEKQPTFPGGTKAMYQFLSANIRYPKQAQEQKIQGKVFVSFVVNTDGSIDRIQILKGIGRGCDEEAVRVVSIMPKWKPGTQSGRPVAVMYNLPISFSLGEKKVGMNQTTEPDKRFGYAAKDSIDVHKGGSVTLYAPTKLPTRVNSRANPPLIFLDGAEISQDVMEAIDLNKIQSIDVLKDVSATSIYGLKGKNGVILIKTKKVDKVGSRQQPVMKLPDSRIDVLVKNSPKVYHNKPIVAVDMVRFLSKDNAPLYLVDGEETSQEDLKDVLDPNVIQSMEVLKDASATATYGLKGKNGVIRITTRKAAEAAKKKN
ncbi:TonB family protein [Fibrella aquatica]|uniref:TonB family protein n=1 Tax=Fibrella aquatica TaxID=3242487 RepID=UPI00351FB314